MKYQIMAHCWNGKDYDITKKEVDTKEKVIGTFKLLMKNTNLHKISIIGDADTNLQDHK